MSDERNDQRNEETNEAGGRASERLDPIEVLRALVALQDSWLLNAEIVDNGIFNRGTVPKLRQPPS